MTQSTQSLGFHVGEGKNAGSPQPMRFHLPPNAFARIQLRTITGKQIHAQPSLIAPNFFSHFARLVVGMAIPNQKNGLRASSHQAVQKSANHFRIQSAFFDHKPHVAPPIHHAEHVQSIPCARSPYHRSLPLTSPGRPCMKIAAQSRFIPKPDLRSQLLGFPRHRRIFLLHPLPHPLRILLIRPPQRLLGSDAQLGQQTTHRIGAQSNIIPLINQRRDGIARPQGKGELILPGITADHHPINPCDYAPIQLAGTPSSLPSIQGIPPACPIHRQPVVDASAAKPYGTDDDLRAFSALHSCHRSFSKFRQHFMLQFPAIHHFLFHGRYYILSAKKCLYYFVSIYNRKSSVGSHRGISRHHRIAASSGTYRPPITWISVAGAIGLYFQGEQKAVSTPPLPPRVQKAKGFLI